MINNKMNDVNITITNIFIIKRIFIKLEQYKNIFKNYPFNETLSK